MTQRNELDISKLINEVSGLLSDLLENMQKFYNDDINDDFLKTLFGSITWINATFKKLQQKTTYSKDDFRYLNHVNMQKNLIMSVKDNQIPSLMLQIKNFVELKQEPEISKSAEYQSIISKCNDCLAIPEKIKPALDALIHAAEAEEKQFKESKLINTNSPNNN